MFDWLPNTKNTITATNGVSTATATVNNRWLTSAPGKLGYAWDRVLLYGKGALPWIINSESSASIGGTSFGVSSNSTNWGWTGGIGVECPGVYLRQKRPGIPSLEISQIG